MAYIYKTKKPKPSISPVQIKLLWFRLKKQAQLLNDSLEYVERYGGLEAAEKIHKQWNPNALLLRYWIEKYRADITDYVKQLGYKVT